MLADAGSVIVDVVEVVAAIAPIPILIVLAWWFLRAGRRFDERERAAGRRPGPD